MGVVYRAVHEQTGAVVALKTVAVSAPPLLSSIRREIHALRSIEHPGVVRIVAEGLWEGGPWYAMELLEGRSLRAHLDALHGDAGEDLTRPARTPTTAADATTLMDPSAPPSAPRDPLGPRSPAVAARRLGAVLALVRSVCEPLAVVHGKGIVHRDLKPDNVIVRPDGTAVLVDFGLAFQFADAEGRDILQLVGGGAKGTPAYMAPEQIRGEMVDARADLYALGCVLYEVLTGAPPFQGAPAGVLGQHLFELPVPPSGRVEGIAPALESLVLTLLQKRPQDRLGYADDVAAALDRLSVGAGRGRRGAARQPYLYRAGFVGREAALDRLDAALDGALGRRGSALFVGGESGVGKTRLVTEVANRAARRKLVVVTGECMAVAAGDAAAGGGLRGAPLHPFRPLLVAVADRCRALGRAETTRLLGDHGVVLAAYEPALADLPGVRGSPPPSPLPAQGARERLLGGLSATLAAFAEAQPVLLIVDDLQWADENSLAFLRALDAQFLADKPLMIVGTYRAEEMNGALRALVTAPGSAGVDLRRLDAAEVARMIGEMLAIEAPPDAFVAWLALHSEGNPFFIAEYLRTSVEEGVLSRKATGRWSVDASRDDLLGGALPLPDALRVLVRRRVAGLRAPARGLARLAAVLGREFDGDLLQATGHLDGDAALEVLEELLSRQILEEPAPGKLRFTHDKLRETVYGDIPPEERRALHGAVGSALEQRYAGRADLPLVYPLLAHHFALARAEAKTLDYLEKAGDQALGTGASGEARDFFRRAIELADRGIAGKPLATSGRRARWERRLAQACYNLGDLREAETYAVAALQHLEGWPGSAGGAYRSRPRVAVSLGLGLARQLGHLAALAGAAAVRGRGPASGRVGPATARPGPTPPRPPAGEERERLTDASLAAELLGEIHFFRNEPLLAFRAALLAATFAERLGASAELARSYATLSVAFGLVPFDFAVRTYAHHAAQTAEGLGDAAAVSWVSFLRGLSAVGSARLDVARDALERSVAVARELRDRRREEECAALLASVLLFEGQVARSLATYVDLQARARRSGNAQALIWATNGQGQCLIHLGQDDEALEAYGSMASLVNRSGDRSDEIARGHVALAELRRGDAAGALRTVGSTLALSRDTAPSAYHCIYGYVAACDVLLTLWEGGDPRATPSLAAEACRALRRYARVFALGRAAALVYQGLHDWLAGRPGSARARWTRALSAAERLGLPADAARAHYELARHGGPADPARRGHLLAARDLYRRLEAAPGLRRTEALLAG